VTVQRYYLYRDGDTIKITFADASQALRLYQQGHELWEHPLETLEQAEAAKLRWEEDIRRLKEK
jgi:hypothetical protein